MPPTAATLTTSPAGGCRPRGLVVEQELPELLAAFTAREELRRRGAPLAEVVSAADRLAMARTAVRAAC